jgi:hypothetical protein
VLTLPHNAHWLDLLSALLKKCQGERPAAPVAHLLRERGRHDEAVVGACEHRT